MGSYYQVSTKRILPAFILSTFLGIFGAHRFYTGKVGSGVAMLILTLTFIGIFATAVWNFIDWITILVGGFRDGDGRVIKEWV